MVIDSSGVAVTRVAPAPAETLAKHRRQRQPVELYVMDGVDASGVVDSAKARGESLGLQ